MSYQSEVLADSPLLYVRFSETAGATCANSGSLGGNATAVGTFTRNIAALAGITPGITLGGTTSDAVTYPDTAALDLTSDITFEIWLKSTSFAGYQALISKGRGGLCLRVNPSRQLEALVSFLSVRATSTGTIPNDGNWHHCVYTKSSANANAFYIDGAAAGTSTAGSGLAANALDMQIGRDVDTGPSYATPVVGSVDEAAVYNTVLSGARVLAHFNAASAAAAAPFVPQLIVTH